MMRSISIGPSALGYARCSSREPSTIFIWEIKPCNSRSRRRCSAMCSMLRGKWHCASRSSSCRKCWTQPSTSLSASARMHGQAAPLSTDSNRLLHSWTSSRCSASISVLPVSNALIHCKQTETPSPCALRAWRRPPLVLAGPAPADAVIAMLLTRVAEQGFETLLGLALLRDGLRVRQVDRVADHDQPDHAHAVVRLALEAVDAGPVERDGDVLVHLALERRCAIGAHALDREDIVTLVGSEEPDRVAGGNLHERRLER